MIIEQKNRLKPHFYSAKMTFGPVKNFDLDQLPTSQHVYIFVLKVLQLWPDFGVFDIQIVAGCWR